MMEEQNWKRKMLLVGVVGGALLGAATAYLLIRTAEDAGDGPPTLATMDLVKVAVATIGTMRGIAALGDRKG